MHLSRWRTVWSQEHGNTLLLFPFAVLIVLALGAIALDAAVAFQADRRAVDEAGALANDIAGALDTERFFAAPGAPDALGIDPGFAAAARAAANARLAPELSCTHRIEGIEVSVTCTGTVAPILLPAVGDVTRFRVGGTATATANEN